MSQAELIWETTIFLVELHTHQRAMLRSHTAQPHTVDSPELASREADDLNMTRAQEHSESAELFMTPAICPHTLGPKWTSDPKKGNSANPKQNVTSCNSPQLAELW